MQMSSWTIEVHSNYYRRGGPHAYAAMQRCNRSTFFSTGTGTGRKRPDRTGPTGLPARNNYSFSKLQEKELETGLTVCK